MAQVVAVLGKGVVDPSQPILLADDLGAVRGDGMFETINVRAGVPWQLEPHLTRMARSAAKLGIALPEAEQLRELAQQAIAEFGDHDEGALRMVCTRGPETGGDPTVFATLNPVPATARAERRDGLRLTALSLGYPVDTRGRSPWLLGGAKTLSYAVTMAALRYAKDNGFDDALWVSEDDFAFEGPTSTLLWQDGDQLLTVPDDTGILRGTTAAFLLERAGELGLRPAEGRIRVRELADVDGAWMVSSVRGVAPIVSIDDKVLPRSPHNAGLQRIGGFPIPA